MDLKFNCPSCSTPLSGDETMNGQTINCPDCGHEFTPFPKPENARRNLEIEKQNKITLEVERLHSKAGNFSILAVILCVIGFFACAFGLVNTINPDEAGPSSSGFWHSAAWCFGTALFLYLVAQVIHIRALLSRRA